MADDAQEIIGKWTVRVKDRVVPALLRWEVAAVGMIALVCGGAAAYRIGYEPLWQDELASLLAAQGVRSHLLPTLPSGLLYFKGELYSVLLAIDPWHSARICSTYFRAPTRR